MKAAVEGRGLASCLVFGGGKIGQLERVLAQASGKAATQADPPPAGGSFQSQIQRRLEIDATKENGCKVDRARQVLSAQGSEAGHTVWLSSKKRCAGGESRAVWGSSLCTTPSCPLPLGRLSEQ